MADGDRQLRRRWTSRSTPATRPTASSATRREWVRDARSRAGPLNPGSGRRPGDLGAIRSARAAAPLIADARHPGELHRRPGLRRLRRGTVAPVLRPRLPGRRLRRLAELPGPVRSCPGAVRGGRPRRSVLRHLRQPRRAGPGQRRRERRVRAGRDRLREADVTGGHGPGHATGGALERALNDRGDLAGSSRCSTTDPTKVGLVPPDPNRQYVSKKQYKDIFVAGTQADGHGFGFVDPAEETASGGAAGLLRLEPEARLSLHRARHPLRGRRDRALGRRQHRRPAVSVAPGPARGGHRAPTSWWSSSATTRSRA